MRLYKVSVALFILWVTSLTAAAQTPVITDIDKTRGTVNEIVTISGSGFGSDTSKIRVFFGAALAVIDSINDNRIEAIVPAGATSSSISVTNLNNNLTAYSGKQFNLSYDGSGFEATKLDGEYKFATSGTNLYNLCFCDFNLDSLTDIATSDTESKKVTILQNNSPDLNTVSFTPAEFDIDAKTRWVRCGDLNGDGLPDLVFSASNTNTSKEKIYIFRNTSAPGGNITFEDKLVKSPVTSYSIDGNLAARMDLKDLDGDGLPEIVAVDISSAGGISVFKNQSTPGGAISFVSTPITPFQAFDIPSIELVSVDIEDLNGDGLPELLAGKEEQNGVYIFTNASTQGNISFSSYLLLDAPGRTTNMKAGDLDGDDKPEVVIMNDTYVGVFRNTTEDGGDVTFATQIRFDQTSLAREGLDMADMDGNGKLDIVIGSTTNRVVVLLNNSTEESLDFNTKTTLLVDENNISVRAGDLNGDGKPDLAYTARTTNTIAVLLNRNCIQPVLEPQAGLGVCDELPFQLTVTQAIGITYVWESSPDGITFTPVADAADSTFSYTTSNEAFYRVKISSSHNGFTCTDVLSNVVEVIRPEGFVPDSPTIIDPNPEDPYCFGETVIIKAENVNAEFVWIDPHNDTITNATTNVLVLENVTAADAGEYQVFVRASPEQGGCQSAIATTTILISEPAAIAIQSEDLPVFFEGGQAILRVENIVGSTYSWKRNGQIIDGATGTELIATQEGDYVATISNSLGCTRESTPYVIAIAQAGIPDEICLNETVNFQFTSDSLAGRGVRYRWDFGDGSTRREGSAVSHSYNTTGTFTVAVEILSTEGIAVDRYEEEITILDLPVLNITATNNAYLCPGESVELTASEGFSAYTWDTGETSEAITVSEAGTYTLSVMANSGCAISKTIEVEAADTLETTITARIDRISLGDTITLQLVATPNDTAATYLWSPGHTLSDSTAANPVARPLITTTYTCTVTSEEGCQSTAEFTLTVDRALDVAARKAFTPNSDGRHDNWYIERMDLYPDCLMTIYNRQGIKVYETENYSNDNGWDGTIQGRPAPAGVYFYLINCGEEAGRQAGSVTVVR